MVTFSKSIKSSEENWGPKLTSTDNYKSLERDQLIPNPSSLVEGLGYSTHISHVCMKLCDNINNLQPNRDFLHWPDLFEPNLLYLHHKFCEETEGKEDMAMFLFICNVYHLPQLLNAIDANILKRTKFVVYLAKPPSTIWLLLNLIIDRFMHLIWHVWLAILHLRIIQHNMLTSLRIPRRVSIHLKKLFYLLPTWSKTYPQVLH